MHEEANARIALPALDPTDLPHVQLNFRRQRLLGQAPLHSEPTEVSADDLFPTHRRDGFNEMPINPRTLNVLLIHSEATVANLFFCTSCGARVKPRVRNRGSSAIEIILWLCFVFPGILYTLWRMGRKDRYCRTCGAQGVIPADSPMARQFLSGGKGQGFGQ